MATFLLDLWGRVGLAPTPADLMALYEAALAEEHPRTALEVARMLPDLVLAGAASREEVSMCRCVGLGCGNYSNSCAGRRVLGVRCWRVPSRLTLHPRCVTCRSGLALRLQTPSGLQAPGHPWSPTACCRQCAPLGSGTPTLSTDWPLPVWLSLLHPHISGTSPCSSRLRKSPANLRPASVCLVLVNPPVQLTSMLSALADVCLKPPNPNGEAGDTIIGIMEDAELPVGAACVLTCASLSVLRGRRDSWRGTPSPPSRRTLSCRWGRVRVC